MAYLFTPYLCGCSGRSGAAFHAFWKDRARFYSYLHRVWSKTSDKPVWMDQAEKATGDFY
ncbi:protein [Escherichia coli]|nr:protein [Escherichia coli]